MASPGQKLIVFSFLSEDFKKLGTIFLSLLSKRYAKRLLAPPNQTPAIIPSAVIIAEFLLMLANRPSFVPFSLHLWFGVREDGESDYESQRYIFMII